MKSPTSPDLSQHLLPLICIGRFLGSYGFPFLCGWHMQEPPAKGNDEGKLPDEEQTVWWSMVVHHVPSWFTASPESKALGSTERPFPGVSLSAFTHIARRSSRSGGRCPFAARPFRLAASGPTGGGLPSSRCGGAYNSCKINNRKVIDFLK
jgi:hypothetical protein